MDSYYFLTSRATHIWSLEPPVFSPYVCRKTLIAPFSRRPLPFSGRAGICHFHSGFATMYSTRLPPPGGAIAGGHMWFSLFLCLSLGCGMGPNGLSLFMVC